MSVIVLKLNFAQEPRSEGVKDYSNSLNGVKHLNVALLGLSCPSHQFVLLKIETRPTRKLSKW